VLHFIEVILVCPEVLDAELPLVYNRTCLFDLVDLVFQGFPQQMIDLAQKDSFPASYLTVPYMKNKNGILVVYQKELWYSCGI
jgi:hypothetical protein